MSKDGNVSKSLPAGSACAAPHVQGSSRAGDQRWAHFRFSVVGPLLAAPPDTGGLGEEIRRLASKHWRHPITGNRVVFGASTIERWYYQALRSSKDPVGVLSRKIRDDQGTHPSLSLPLRALIDAQYRKHRDWSYKLHADNLAVCCAQDPGLGAMPSYESVRRYMKAHDMIKRRRLGGKRRSAGADAAEQRFDDLEVRSYESAYVNALWHLDFHHSSVPVLTSPGEWVHPILLGVLDDHSRLCCHVQWYLHETAENLIHGLVQAFMKRGLPRALMTDNGSAMTAHETTQGLVRLGIVHERTLPYSPYQNGKQESFWGPVEGRLLAMLDGVKDLTLARLNEATQAWAEMEHNRSVQSQIGCKPLERFINGKDVGRMCPESEILRQVFTEELSRKQRKSDGTISVEGKRFEVPSRYRHLDQVTVRYAKWDLSHVYLCDGRSGQVLARLYPQDKQKNGDGQRRRKEAITKPADCVAEEPDGQVAPLLSKLIADYAATGVPPAYLPKDEINKKESKSHE